MSTTANKVKMSIFRPVIFALNHETLRSLPAGQSKDYAKRPEDFYDEARIRDYKHSSRNVR